MGQHRTPLRYPGGKQRLAPFIDELLVANECIKGHYVEPYAGGAGVAIELLLNDRVNHIHLNDSSIHIFSFWQSILCQTEKFCRHIFSASFTVDEWKRQRNIVQHPENHDEFEIGFSTFYLNRCNRSGVLSGGLIGGLAQSGEWKMDARFSRNDLIRRIEAIASKKQFISLYNRDAENFIVEVIPQLPVNTFVYCDPPYFKKSNRLYLNHYKESDHSRIAKTIQDNLSKRWIVSYDGAPQILECYKDRRKFLYNLQYNASRVYKGQEVFIFSDDAVIPTQSILPHVNEALPTKALNLFA